MIKKIASDSIAQEMFLLLKKASAEEDDAKSHTAHSEADSAEDDLKAGHAEDSAEDEAKEVHSEDAAKDEEDSIEDYLMSDVEDDASTAEAYVDDMSDSLMRRSDGSFEHEADDAGVDMLMASANDIRLMSGLGKIEASLRRKGEGFAADLVRTTALSIREDIVKEASQKSFVIKNLVKMAQDLDSRGEKAASELVKNTIRKIN